MHPSKTEIYTDYLSSVISASIVKESIFPLVSQYDLLIFVHDV